MSEKAGLMVLGIGAMAAGVLLLTIKKKPALPAAPPDGVLVSLLNPPAGAEIWQMGLCDQNLAHSYHNSTNGAIAIDQPMTFDIPQDAVWPLRVTSLQISKWNQVNVSIIVLYEAQSFQPYLWDWDTFDWGTEPNPSYRDIFIEDYGSYYYNVGKERFEKG